MKPIPMAPKHQNIPSMTLPAPKLGENCLSYGKTNFPYNFASKSGELELTPTKYGVVPPKMVLFKNHCQTKLVIILMISVL